MREIIVFAGSAVGSVLSLLEQIKNETNCVTYVICLNSDFQSIFSISNFVDFTHSLKYKKEEFFFAKFKDWFDNVGFKDKPIIYVTTDTSCYLINKNRKWFENNCVLCLPSSEILNIYTNKSVAERAAEQNGLLIPRTTSIDKVEDLRLILENYKFPVIIKPKSSYQEQKPPFKVKVLKREDFYDITKEYLNMNYNFVCQEFIPGGDESSYFYIFYRSSKGVIHSVIGRKVLQNPPRAGIMAKGLVEDNPVLAKQCEEFLERINYKGIGGIEFKKHDNKYYFIEMSTRLEGFFKITTIANVPLGIISYYDLVGETLDSVYKQKEGALYVDFISMLMAHKKEKTYLKLFSDLCNSAFNKCLQFNIYSKSDRKPFFAILKSYFK